MLVIERFKFAENLFAPGRGHSGGDFLHEPPVLLRFWTPEAILIPLSLRLYEPALVHRPPPIQHAPVNARPPARLAGIEHMPHARLTPGHPRLEHPIRVGQRRG